MRVCIKCYVSIDSIRGKSVCKACVAARREQYDREYVRRPQTKQQGSARRRQYRADVLKQYGGVCSCCGENRFEFLAIDHVDGGGRKHREEVGSGINLLNWIVKNNYPKTLRVLCANCNSARGFYGHCPHENELTQQRDAFVAALGVA